LAVAAVLTAAVWLIPYFHQELVQAQGPKSTASGADQPQQETPDVAAVRRNAEAFAKAFNEADAKAMSACWTPDCEYEGPDGDKLRGRAAIAKA
jgi:hypothetical protein